MEESKMRKLSIKGRVVASAIMGFLLGGLVSPFVIAYLMSKWEIFGIGMVVSGFTFLLFYGVYIIEKHRPI